MVAHPEPQHIDVEVALAGRIRDLQDQMPHAKLAGLEATDVSARLEGPLGATLSVKELQDIPRWIGADEQRLHASFGPFLGSAIANRLAGAFERRSHTVERGSVGDLPADEGETFV